MDLNRVAVFTAVVDAGGFSAAARKLGVPKSTISKKVTDLEVKLGVRLLNRTTRSLTLTEAGARLHGHCKLALHQMEIAEREVQALQSEPEGLLQVGAPSALGVQFLLPIIADLIARYPTLRVNLVAVNDDIRGLDDAMDVLIWPGVLEESVHAISLVATIGIGLFASREYLRLVNEPLVPSALERHKVVAFTQSLQNGQFAWNLSRRGTTVRVVPETPPDFMSNDAAAVMGATCLGYGIGALPIGYVANSPMAATLKRILPEWEAAQLGLNAFFRDGSSTSAKTRVFLDAVTQWFQRAGIA